jgi:hypothetical protein
MKSHAMLPTHTYDAIPQPQPQAIVVYCSDPRFQTAFDRFIEEGLGLRKGQFIPLVVAGGAGPLAHPERMPKEFKFMRDRLDLFCGHFPSLQRLVLVNHEDCAYYRLLAEKVPGSAREHAAAGPFHHSRDDLEQVAGVFHRLLARLGLALELYYARFTDGDHRTVTFDPIADDSAVT